MKWIQALIPRLQHKYAINAKVLGDPADCAWTNLGYWTDQERCYPDACQQLAQQLADTISLNSKDKLLDLGCGQGASLKLWKSQYHVAHIEAMDIQPACVNHIDAQMPFIHRVICGSFLNLKKEEFEFKFDAVLCIDAAYHGSLNNFLHSVSSVLNSKARIGFHYLVLTERFAHLNSFEKLKLKALLKSADIRLADLRSYSDTEQCIRNFGFEHVQIENLSQAVLHGFSHYIQTSTMRDLSEATRGQWRLDLFKIQMTAKLCKSLYQAGLVDYVQISAIYGK